MNLQKAEASVAGPQGQNAVRRGGLQPRRKSGQHLVLLLLKFSKGSDDAGFPLFTITPHGILFMSLL